MNCRVTQNARLEQARLVVERRSSRRSAKARRGVALQAEQVDVAQFQHVRIWSAVHQMAGLATINLHRLMFEYKRSLLVRVAREANRILSGRSAHLMGPHGAVRIVAIGALDEAFIYSMVERHIELSSLRQMARVAKLGLSFYQQEFFCFRMMRRMAGNAADVVLRMHRIDGIHVFGATGVARQAAGVDILCRVILEDKNLGDIPATSDVGRSWPMTAFASLVRRAALRIERGLPVRTLLPGVVNVVVASLADFRSYIFGRRRSACGRLVRRALVLLRRTRRFFLGLSPNERRKQTERE